MPNIKPISDLRNYGVILKDVAPGQPVILTKNGQGKYALLSLEDYEEYEKLMALRQLLEELKEEKKANFSCDLDSLEKLEGAR